MIIFTEELKGFEIMMKEVPRYSTAAGQAERERLTASIRKSRSFRNGRHKELFLATVCECTKGGASVSNEFLAAIYLFTASERLWECAQSGIYRNDIDFKRISTKRMGIINYCLLKAAEDIYTDSMHFSIGEIASPDIISDNLLQIIMNAVVIKRGKFQKSTEDLWS